jgi:hypothetical protein
MWYESNIVKKSAAQKPGSPSESSPSELIDARIRELGDWRGEMLARIRALIKQADPEVVEEWKWAKATSPGVPVWSHDGIVCTGETYKSVVKMTFAKGASLEDPSGLFNSSLEGNVRRAIDFHEGDKIDEKALKALVRSAVALNASSAASRRRPGKARTAAGKGGPTTAGKNKEPEKPALLAGGNPQIAKADGDAPVQAYIEAMPGWKRDVGRRLDALIVRNAPNARRAVKWNSPFYGIEGQGWFASFHTFTNYVKVTFFQGRSLRPVPPGGKSKDARWIDVREDDLDEAQLATWVKQAAALPGWVTSDIRP